MSEEKNGGGISLATKLRRKPENFFPVVVDNFFDNPEALVDYGKSLPKGPDPAGNYPGKRSDVLWAINYSLGRAIILKILSCYYDLDYIDLSWDSSMLAFQEIPRFSENKNDIKNKGWIHQDDNDHAQLAGLIYLTPNIDPDSGTSLYTAKSNEVHQTHAKFLLYDDAHFNKEQYEKSYIKHRSCFIEKLRFQNIFNRLIMYDTGEWHRANSFYNGDGEDARLTLAFFVGGISISPLKRIKNNEYESVIKQIEGKNENQ